MIRQPFGTAVGFAAAVVRSVGLMLGATIALLGQPLDGQRPDCVGGVQCYATRDLSQPDVCEASWDLSTGCFLGIDIRSGCLVGGSERGPESVPAPIPVRLNLAPSTLSRETTGRLRLANSTHLGSCCR